MHDHHKGSPHPHHDHGHQHGERDDLKRLLAMLGHWIEHGDSHAENYREWAQKASDAGEEEIAREIHLALDDNESVANHLKRAKAVLAAKLVLRK